MRVDELADSASLVKDQAGLRRRLADDGYLFFRGLLPADEIRAAGQAVLATLRAGGWVDDRAIPSIEPRAVNSMDALRDPAFRQATTSAAFNRVPYLPALRAAVRRVLGPGSFSYPAKVLRAVYPERPQARPRGRYIHYDYGVAGVQDMLTSWIPLMDIPVRIGGLAVQPGGHLRPPRPPRPLSASERGWATTSYEPGDVIIFHCLTPHAALPNTSSALRISGDFRWQRPDQPAPAELILGPRGPGSRQVELFSRMFGYESWWEPVPAGLALQPRAQMVEVAPGPSRLVTVHPGWKRWRPPPPARVHLPDRAERTIMPVEPLRLEPEEERRLAATIFNHVWELLDEPERSTSQDDEMLHAAHASRYLWGEVGGPVHWARGEWQCARVYAVLGRFEPALHHARRCLELVTQHDLGPFDLGAAHEAIARAYRVIGDAEMTARHVALARAEAAGITDAEDRQILDSDLASLLACADRGQQHQQDGEGREHAVGRHHDHRNASPAGARASASAGPGGSGQRGGQDAHAQARDQHYHAERDPGQDREIGGDEPDPDAQPGQGQPEVADGERRRGVRPSAAPTPDEVRQPGDEPSGQQVYPGRGGEDPRRQRGQVERQVPRGPGGRGGLRARWRGG